MRPHSLSSEGAEYGFSLLELIIAAALIAILLTSGIYGYRELFSARVSREEPLRFINSLEFARSYALANKRAVFVCPGGETDSCEVGDYARGWIMLEASAEDHSPPGPGSSRAISVNHQLPVNFSVKTNVFSDFIRFSEYGRSHANGHFFFCRDGVKKAAAGVFIIRSGRIRNARDDEMNVCPG